MRRPRKTAGFSYAEILVATLLLAVSLVPALQALQGGLLSSSVDRSLTLSHVRLRSKMEDVLARPYAELARAEAEAGGAPSEFSDPMGTPERCLVLIARVDADDADGDGDPATGTDPGLLLVRVQIEGTERAIATLAAE